MIGGVPDFRISVYNLETSKKVVIPETKLPCKPEEFLSAQFNPSNRNHFAILSQTCFYNFNIHPAFDVTEKKEANILCQSFRLEHQTWKDENPETVFSKFIWDQYGRCHICCDTPQLIQLDAKTQKVENTVNLSSRCVTAILTQKHMIVSLEEGLMQWLKIELPEIVINEKDAADQSLKVLEEVEQEWTFNVQIGESNIPDFITHMHYTRSYKHLVMGTETGIFGTLAVEAEMVNEEYGEEEAQQVKEKKTLTVPFKEMGRYHTMKITGIKELGDTTQLVTISEDHYMSVWEVTTQEMLATVFQPAHPTSLDVSRDGAVAFVGTAMGAFRIYDLRDRQNPRLVTQQRFFEDAVPIDIIRCSIDGNYVLISSTKSKQVYILSQKASK